MKSVVNVCYYVNLHVRASVIKCFLCTLNCTSLLNKKGELSEVYNPWPLLGVEGHLYFTSRHRASRSAPSGVENTGDQSLRRPRAAIINALPDNHQIRSWEEPALCSASHVAPISDARASLQLHHFILEILRRAERWPHRRGPVATADVRKCPLIFPLFH